MESESDHFDMDFDYTFQRRRHRRRYHAPASLSTWTSSNLASGTDMISSTDTSDLTTKQTSTQDEVGSMEKGVLDFHPSEFDNFDNDDDDEHNLEGPEPEHEMIEQQEIVEVEAANENKHPLFDPEFLRNVFRLLPDEDLKTCSIVCKMWNFELKKRSQKKVISLFSGRSPGRFYSGNITYYLQHFGRRHYHEPSHRMFRLVTDNLTIAGRPMKKFFTIHGQYITNLIFEETEELPLNTLYQLLHELPNLKALGLRYIPSIGDPTSHVGVERSFPSIEQFSISGASFCRRFFFNWENDANPEELEIALGVLLSTFTQLKTFSQSCSNKREDTEIIAMHLFKALVSVPTEKMANLEKIGFTIYLNQMSVDLLKYLDLSKLSEINACFEMGLENDQMLASLFSMKFSSVVSAHFIFNCQAQVEQFCSQSSKMQKLQHVTLNASQNDISLAFLLETNNLVSINASVSRIKKPYLHPKLVHGLRELKLRTERPLLVTDIWRLTNALPDLQVLHINGLSDASLRVIIRDLPYIVELGCLDGNFTDNGVTGIHIGRLQDDFIDSLLNESIDPGTVRSDLFIGNFLNLRTLRLESNHLTYLSIIYGIKDCKNLKTLYIKSRNFKNEELIKAVQDLRGLRFLSVFDVSSCSCITEEFLDIARNAAPNLQISYNISHNMPWR